MYLPIFKLLIRYGLIEEKHIYNLSFVNKELNKEYIKYRRNIKPIYDIYDDIKNIIEESKIITFNKYFKFIERYAISHMYCFYEMMEDATHKYIIYSFCKWMFKYQNILFVQNDNKFPNYFEKLLYCGKNNKKLCDRLIDTIFYFHPNIINEDNEISNTLKRNNTTFLCRPELLEICMSYSTGLSRSLTDDDLIEKYIDNNIVSKAFQLYTEFGMG